MIDDSFESYVFKLDATSYDKVYSTNKIFNLDAVEYYLWIKLPTALSCDYKLLNIIQIEKSNRCDGSCCIKCKNEQEIPHDYYHRERNVWIQIIFPALDQDIGKHIYRMEFLTPFEDVISFYFSYIIQNDHPDQPYIYMGKPNPLCEQKSESK